MGMATLSIGNVEAAGWYSCTLNQVGVLPDSGYLVVSSNDSPAAFPAKTPFILDTSQANANKLLAAALTGFANSTIVWVYVNDITPYSLVEAVVPSTY